MRVLADHDVPTDVVQALRHQGLRVQRAYEVGLERASDEALFEYAQKTAQVLLTFDHDFGNIARFPPERSAGIVLVMINGLSKDAIVKRVCQFFAGTRASRLRRKLFFIDRTEIRLWSKR